jgi:hypothetical protein
LGLLGPSEITKPKTSHGINLLGLLGPSEITKPKTSHGINLLSLLGPSEITKPKTSHGINLLGFDTILILWIRSESILRTGNEALPGIEPNSLTGMV